MPKRVRGAWANRRVLEWSFVVALLRLRPACRDDLLAGGGGGLAVRRWCATWNLPRWCEPWAKDYCRQRARSPHLALAGPVLGVVLPTPTGDGWDWLAGEPRQQAEAQRLGAGVVRRAVRESSSATVAALTAANWEPLRVEAVAWLVRRTVPVVLGGEPDTLRAIADESDVPEAVIADETRRAARLLGMAEPLGRRPGRRPEPWRRRWRAVLEKYRAR